MPKSIWLAFSSLKFIKVDGQGLCQKTLSSAHTTPAIQRSRLYLIRQDLYAKSETFLACFMINLDSETISIIA